MLPLPKIFDFPVFHGALILFHKTFDSAPRAASGPVDYAAKHSQRGFVQFVLNTTNAGKKKQEKKSLNGRQFFRGTAEIPAS